METTNFTFDQLPADVNRLFQKMESIEKMLLYQNQNPEQPDQRLNVKEAAEFLGITVPTIYSKNSKGELPACKAPGGKRLFFFRSDLVKYLKQGRQKTTLEIEAEAETYLKK